MKNYIYTSIILLLLTTYINPQKNIWVEDEVIISFQDSIIDLSTAKTAFSLSNIRDEGVIKSEQLKSNLLNNEIEVMVLHPFIKELKNQTKAETFTGRTLKNIIDITSAKIRFREKKDIKKVIQEIKAIKGVYNASPNYVHIADVIPNDYHLNYHPGSYLLNIEH